MDALSLKLQGFKTCQLLLSSKDTMKEEIIALNDSPLIDTVKSFLVTPNMVYRWRTARGSQSDVEVFGDFY